MESLPFAIVGGGICGVLTALKLKQIRPDDEIVLIEKEPYLGHHNTTRNSGVLHAGLYYPNQSLKHKLCMEGYEEWLRLSEVYQIPLDICGKYVIATTEEEISPLEAVYQNAQKNKVQGLRRISDQDRAEISSYTYVMDGFFSSRTGILDISSAIKIFENELQMHGVIVMKNTEVLHVNKNSFGFEIKTQKEEFQVNQLINCAGAWSVPIRQMLGLTNIENYLVKGNYLRVQKPYYNKRLIYPVPPPSLAGLGVHTSFHLDRLVRFGPNTEVVDHVDYINHERNIEIMFEAIRSKFKGIELEHLTIDYSGVRTKIRKDGQLYTDFLIQSSRETGIDGYSEALGIESPGLTAAPAIAQKIISGLGFIHTASN